MFVALTKIKRKDFLLNGVYQIINTLNNKSYVGSCASKTLMYERLIHHRRDLIFKKHYNKHLQSSVNKNGIEHFFVKLLCICQPEDCVKKEQYWIDKLKPEFNIAKIAGNTKGINFTKTRLKRMSVGMKRYFKNHPEAKEKLRNLKSGKKLSRKHVKSIALGLRKKVLDKNTGKIYNSVLEAARKLKVHPSWITNCCKQNREGKRINVCHYEG